MGYIYDEMKKLMNGSNSRSSNGLVANWTPNSYRCIIVSPTFIFIAKHIGNPIISILNRESVVNDLISYSMEQGRGSLHNLFSERQLSCLEEIYFDVEFWLFTNLFDINLYISKVKSSVSRLRYYGYCQIGNNTKIASWLSETYSHADVLYCLAKDKSRVFPIDYKEVGNLNWYKNYNLRPQYYKLDSDKGQLAIYFRKNEKVIEELLAKYGKEDAQDEGESSPKDTLIEVINSDIESLPYIKKFSRLAKYLSDRRFEDEVAEFGYKSICSIMRKDRAVTGLDKGMVEKILGSGMDGKVVSAISGAYESFRVYGRKGTLKKEELKGKKGKGFINITDMWDDLCLSTSDEVNKDNLMRLMISFNVDRHASEIPDGKFKRKYTTKGGSSSSDISGYINYLSDILGININTL